MKWDRGRSVLAALLLVGVTLSPAIGHAFGLEGAGAKLGYVTPEHGNGAPAVGGHLEFAEHGTRWHIVPGFLYWNEDRVNGLNTNLDFYYHFGRDKQASPYLGSGVGLSRIAPDSDPNESRTDLAANVFGGARFPGRYNNFYIEGRQTLTDTPQTSLLAGVTFH
jgi:hypothetical protein